MKGAERSDYVEVHESAVVGVAEAGKPVPTCKNLVVGLGIELDE